MDNLKTRKRSPVAPRFNFSLWYFALAFFVLYGLYQFFSPDEFQALPYSEFKKLLREGKVLSCVLMPDEIQGQLKFDSSTAVFFQEKDSSIFRAKAVPDSSSRIPFTAVRVFDADLVKELEAAKIPYEGKSGSVWWGQS